jgi:hypothetical protein
MAKKKPSLEATLRKVSKNCLHGHPVPKVLRLLWEAQLAGENIVGLGDKDAILLDAPHDTYMNMFLEEGFRLAGAYRRMFQEMAFIGYGCQPLLFGYWLHDKGVTLDTAPFVVLTTEGTFRRAGPTLQDYLLGEEDEEDEENQENYRALREWYAEHGIKTSPPGAWPAALQAWPDPMKRLSSYAQKEA